LVPKERIIRVNDFDRAPDALASPSDIVSGHRATGSGEDVRERLPLRRALKPENRRRGGAMDDRGDSHDARSSNRMAGAIGPRMMGEERMEGVGVSGGAESTDEPVVLPRSLSLLSRRPGRAAVLNETRRWRSASGLLIAIDSGA
jgi:hypothetical protein